jgi:hypothetical protein
MALAVLLAARSTSGLPVNMAAGSTSGLPVNMAARFTSGLPVNMAAECGASSLWYYILYLLENNPSTALLVLVMGRLSDCGEDTVDNIIRENMSTVDAQKNTVYCSRVYM